MTEHPSSEETFSHKGINVTRQDLQRDPDIHDSPEDEARLKEAPFSIDLPDVWDIPGQEHIHVPHFNEMADTTISSADEEGEGLFNDDEAADDPLNDSVNSDVSGMEQQLLQQADEDMPGDDEALRNANLDNTDDDNEPLNEGSRATDISGSDLDTSGTDSDDTMEAIGEEDEENNLYSLGNDDNDNTTEGTP